ncbi:hypothetical protein [Stieleria magnilauensis]|uniref:Uncharacterized protein n=1 Tax=Stieleria magnilauensis TaxID=2527963 RepID=A0ABX5XP89_9BACT|nr:hypothetical protein TBK1r_27460 [Planctomycetes bacterium TBK1r]
MPDKSRKPYTMVGAEQLTASVYKTGDELMGFDYRFNITRLNNRTGRVNQWFTPDDLCAMVKLVRVLSAELAHDGCMDEESRNLLFRLAAGLDDAIAEVSTNNNVNGATNQ